MNDFEEILANANGNNATQEKKPFDKSAWIEKKQQERQEVYDLMDKTADEVKTDINKYKQYLDVQGRFDKYSVGNALICFSCSLPWVFHIQYFLSLHFLYFSHFYFQILHSFMYFILFYVFFYVFP